MITKAKSFRRLTAGLGAIALIAAGAIGSASAASAAGFPVPPDDAGSLTLHKHVEKEGSTPGNPLGAPLQGVVFSVQPIGVQNGAACDALNLTTPAGWQSIALAIAGFPATTPNPPAGFCNLPGVQSVTSGVTGATPALTGLKGLFLVTETSPGPNMIATPAAPFLVTVPQPVPGVGEAAGTWDFTVDAYPKNTLNTVAPTKTVGAMNVDGDVTAPAVVPWTVTTTVPVSAFPYTEIKVTDAPATGHTFVGFNTLMLNGVALVPADYTDPAVNPISLTPLGLAKVNAIVTGTGATSATLSVGVTTQVTGDTLGEIENNASVTLNGQSTPTTVPQTNWGKLSVLKHVKDHTNQPLAGAMFKIYPLTAATCAASPQTAVWTGTSPASGVLEAVLWVSNTNEGVAAGTKTYCLQETAAPTGYLLDSTPREVVISPVGTAITQYNFPNTPPVGPQLPLTGSTGTLMFGLVGLGLVGAAAAALTVSRIRSKRGADAPSNI